MARMERVVFLGTGSAVPVPGGEDDNWAELTCDVITTVPVRNGLINWLICTTICCLLPGQRNMSRSQVTSVWTLVAFSTLLKILILELTRLHVIMVKIMSMLRLIDSSWRFLSFRYPWQIIFFEFFVLMSCFDAACHLAKFAVPTTERSSYLLRLEQAPTSQTFHTERLQRRPIARASHTERLQRRPIARRQSTITVSIHLVILYWKLSPVAHRAALVNN